MSITKIQKFCSDETLSDNDLHLISKLRNWSFDLSSAKFDASFLFCDDKIPKDVNDEFLVQCLVYSFWIYNEHTKVDKFYNICDFLSELTLYYFLPH